MNEIKVGDVVKLKSGGPDMTCHEVGKAVGGGMYAACRWFDGKEVKEYSFRWDELTQSTTDGPETEQSSTDSTDSFVDQPTIAINRGRETKII